MSTFYSICFILCTLFNGGVQCARWSTTSLPDSQKLYACAGDTVTFTWQYALTSEEVLGDVQWLYDGQSQEMVAISTRGNFFSTPTFSQRVSRVDNAGLSLSRVTVPDSGNYSVEVNVYTQRGAVHTVLRSTVMLHISDRLMTTDGVLHVTQLRDPVYDSVSNQWVLQLQCGTFIFKENPISQVEWTTPSGSVHNSTSFSNGNFYLSVPMPIESGSYSCRIPAHLSARACLHCNGTNEGQTSVKVESVEARLLLLEKENSDLRHANRELSTTMAHLTSTMTAFQTSQNQVVTDLASRLTTFQMSQTQVVADLTSQNHTVAEISSTLTSQNQIVADIISRLTALQTLHNHDVQRINSQLTETQSQLTATTTNMQIRLGKIEDAERNRVAFHATELSPSTVTANTPLVFHHVVYNHGNAYSNSTGYFTAPYSGLYFFIAKTAAAADSGDEYHNLMVDNLTIDIAYTYNPSGHPVNYQTPVHGLVHLMQGQRVYVKCTEDVQLWDTLSAFTGFLLSRDP